MSDDMGRSVALVGERGDGFFIYPDSFTSASSGRRALGDQAQPCFAKVIPRSAKTAPTTKMTVAR